MKNFHLILETKEKEDELHFVAKEYKYAFKPFIHKSQYENLSDEEKAIYTPSEFSIGEKEAKQLVLDLMQLLYFKIKEQKPRNIKVMTKPFKNTKNEIHVISSENDNKMFPIHRSQYEKLTENEKKFYMPSEFCMNEEDAYILAIELLSALENNFKNTKE